MENRLTNSQEQEILDRFYSDGYTIVPNVLSSDEVSSLRELADRFIDKPEDAKGRGYAAPVMSAMVLRCTQALHREFENLLVKQPMLKLAELVLGPNVGFCGQNVIRSDENTGISMWHVDDIVEFPLPENVARHDARIRMPIFWFSFQIALSDIGPDDGPTEIVPGSHYSGRWVPKVDRPEFEGRGPEPILCKAGDVYLFNHQLWHRGSINRSKRRRYLMQNQYCRAWGIYRFNSTDANQRLDGEKPERLAKLLEPTRKTPN